MIVVTGTKRSGTSMWMQALQAAGIKALGQAFPKVWKETIQEANKRGFYESRFRRGIYYATNPHPETGAWLPPRPTRHVGVKVFIPGVVRSDVLYLNRVIASVRPFRQYTSSLRRLYDMEKEGHKKRGTGDRLFAHLDPTLEWWLENFILVRDISTRRYPVRLVSYESMLEDPEAICQAIFEFLEVGDPVKAREAVHPEDRTQEESAVDSVSHRFEETFDEYHHRVKTGQAFDESFLAKMNEVHKELLPEIEAGLNEVSAARRARQKRLSEKGQGRKHPDALNLDRLDALLHPANPADDDA